MSRSQQQRLSSETREERQVRQQRDAELHQRARSVDAVVPIFDQPAVVRKIKKFHTDLSNISIVSTCSTCHELLPEHSLESSTECTRCARDSSSSKLYSSDNNMDPGPQLQVYLNIELN